MPTTYAVPDGRAAMAATLYSGNNSTQSVNNSVNGVSMQPDMVWIKSRNISGANHVLTDSVRGVNKFVIPNLTDSQFNIANTLTSFNSNGFSLGNTAYDFNISGNNYVGWQWKAGGTAVTNTAGSITSSVSANTTAGFSIVTYTGTGSNATVGHGLGATPSWIIIKNISSTQAWTVGTAQPAGWDRYMTLNSTDAATLDGTVWNTTNPTSSVFTIGTSLRTNGSGGTYVAYCFATVAGYSKFGSYTGNGSSNGPFVYLGFRPRWLMIKRSDSSGTSWLLLDSTRNPTNTSANGGMQNVLAAQSSGAEDTGADVCDGLSNGFKFYQSATSFNANGATYIYAAFAENPFAYANAR